jgi:peptide/nickel transport system ATP-binding protein
MIADEPTTALDVTIQAQILLLLAQLRREFGMGLVLITHDLGIVARVADRVAVMYAGQIVEQGSAAEVFRQPRHPYTRGLMACIPVPGKVARGSPLGSIPGMVPSLIGDMSGCSFRERCGFRRDACSAEIALAEHAGGHAARCILSPEEIARAA